MADKLPKSLTISCAGTSFINGVYRLDLTQKSIKYIRNASHPLSRHPMRVQVVQNMVPALSATHKCFIIQAQSHNRSSFIDYYIDPSPSLATSSWQCVAGIEPLPTLALSTAAFNALSASHVSSIAGKKMEIMECKKDDDIDDVDGSCLSQLPSTTRTFLSDTYLFTQTAQIVHAGRDSKRGSFLICDATIFHPQGGGQPADKGVISSMDGATVFNVDFVANHAEDKRLVCHFGSYAANCKTFAMGATAQQRINADERELFAKLHSGGHLIDVGMTAIGQKLGVAFEPIKGYHFPNGAYVEYDGNIPLEKRADVKQTLQDVLDAIIKEHQSLATVVRVLSCDSYLDQVVKITDEQQRMEHMKRMKLNKDSQVRVLSFPGLDSGECMCGGTHIDGMHRIKRIIVTKFKKKNNNFRVSYKVE